jgi:hypothetical protein
MRTNPGKKHLRALNAKRLDDRQHDVRPNLEKCEFSSRASGRGNGVPAGTTTARVDSGQRLDAFIFRHGYTRAAWHRQSRGLRVARVLRPATNNNNLPLPDSPAAAATQRRAMSAAKSICLK